MDEKVSYEALKKVLATQGSYFLEEKLERGKVLVLKDNAEIWFYFDKDDKLAHIRSY